MSNGIKQIRVQVRQVVKEILSDVLTTELVSAMEIRVMQYLKKRLDLIDQRSKDIQAYMIRQSAPMAPAPIKVIDKT